MCGLAVAVVGPAWFERTVGQLGGVTASIQHRGPDGVSTGSFRLGQTDCIYAHTRLAIIDPRIRSNQPFSSEDGRWILLFNGEIYNYVELRAELVALGYRFKTTSDSEVLLNSWIAWRHEALARFQGMFAFFIADTEQGEAFLFRDQFGMKPFYYLANDAGVYLASEIGALQEMSEIRPTPNQQAVHDYIAYGAYDLSADTFFHGVQSLLPGHMLRIDASGNIPKFTNARWHEIQSVETNENESAAIQDVREAILASVEMHLRSDVEVGVALSGGLDSSVLAAAIREISPGREVLSFCFSSGIPESDESEYGKLVANHLGFIHTEVRLSLDDVRRSFDATIKSQGEPFATLSVFAQNAVYEAAASSGIKVVIDGQGGDEVFAGYDGYFEYRLRSLVARKDLRGLCELLRSLQRENRSSRFQVLVRFLQSLAPPEFRAAAVQLMRPYVGQGLLRANAQLDAAGIDSLRRESLRPFLGPRLRVNDLSRRLGEAIYNGDLWNLVRHSDRSSMRFSVESRMPFLSAEVVRAAQALPDYLLLSNEAETKHALRHAFRQFLPPAIVGRRDKVGFVAADTEILSGLLSESFFDSEALALYPWLDNKKVALTVGEFQAGNHNLGPLVWRLVNLARWTQLSLN